MTEEKLYSLLELKSDTVYEIATDGFKYKIKNGVLLSASEYNPEWEYCGSHFSPNLKQFYEVKQKKKITLYRIIVKNEGYRASVWDSSLDYLKKWASGALIIKTETKEIEIDE